MKAKNRIFDFLFYFTVGLLCAFSISINSLTATVMGGDLSKIFFYTLIFMSIFYIWFYNKYTFLIISGLMGIGFVILLIGFWRDGATTNVYLTLKEELLSLAEFMIGFGAFKDGYDTLLEIIIVFLVSLVVSSTIKNWLGFYAITLLGAITIFIPAINNWEKSNLGRYLFLICFIVLLLEKLKFLTNRNAKDDVRINHVYALLVLPLAGALVLGATFLPTFNIEQVSVLDEIHSAGKSIISDATQKTSIVQRNQKTLGGPLRLGNEDVMEVVSSKPVYLKGMIMETYTGDMWYNKMQKRNRITIEENSYNIADTAYASTKLAALKAELGVGENTVVVKPHENSPTKRIYVPPFPQQLSMLLAQPTILADEHGVLWVSKEMEVGEEYTQSYIDWNYDDELFQSRLRELSENAISDPQYLSQYLQLPEGVTQRTRDLTAEITADTNSDYAKLRAIESHLRENYPYTLETSELPTDEDFVDYFLFTEKQGYCVYYATAMAVMGRIEGIPTRYVEGFVMPPQRNENGNYSVTNQQAHAWVEGFFPEFGWVRFEPTSAYLADAIATPLDESDSYEETPEPPEEDSTDEEAEAPEITPSTEEPTVETNTETAAPKKKMPKMVATILIVLLSIAILIVFVAFMIDYHKNKFEAIKKQPAKQKANNYFVHTFRILSVLGYKIDKAETFTDFAHRIQPSLNYNITGLNELFNKATYSDLDITQEDAELAEDAYNQLLDELTRKEKNKLKVLVQRYFFMRY